MSWYDVFKRVVCQLPVASSACVVVALAVIDAAPADLIGNAAEFRTVNTTTGTSALIQDHPFSQSGDIAYDPNANVLYMTDGASNSIFSVDPNTGDVTMIANILPDMTGMAFDPDTDTIYATDTLGGNLYRINPTTGAPTLIGQYTTGASAGDVSRFMTGLAFDPTTDTLYGLGKIVASANDVLFRLNTGTGAATEIGAVGPSVFGARALGIDLVTGQLFTADNNTRQLIEINNTTGEGIAFSAPGSLGIDFFGLASGPIPEPTTAALLALAVPLIARRRARS